MKKKYRSTFIVAYILIILVGVIWHTGGVSAENTIKLTVNSRTTNTAAMSNMQPGDEMSSTYTIINDGNEPFDYFVDFKFISGDQELYNVLHMVLQKEGVTLYSGAMSDAAGRVAIGSLAGGGQSILQMDVVFPWEVGNEFQGKATTVAFEFSASGQPEPSTKPSSAPETPTPTSVPPTPVVTAPPGTAPPTTPTATDSSAPPSAGPTESPQLTSSPTPSPDSQVIVVSEAPIPLGGGSNNSASPPSPSTGSDSANQTAPNPEPEVSLEDEEIPLAGPEDGDKLPDTAEPWYNLILISAAIAIISFLFLRRLKSKR